MVAFLLLSTTLCFSQEFVLDQCPENIECVISEAVYFVTIPAPTGSTSDVISCNETSFSQMNLKFEATSELMTFEASWSTNDELVLGVVSNCGEENSCIYTSECNASGYISFTLELSPGRTYILYLDGCGHTSPVEVDVSIDGPAQTELFNELFAVNVEGACEEIGVPVLCSNEEFLIQLDLEEYDYWNSRNATWLIEYEGPLSGFQSYESLDDMYLYLEEPGEYTICLEMVELECRPYYPIMQNCAEILIGQGTRNYGEYDVCEHDLKAGWVPDQYWAGEVITKSGEYEARGNGECGCEVNQVIVVNRIRERETEIEVELCPQDYPYDYMGLEEYEYSQLNIEDVHVFEEGSYNEDYAGNACDSIIYLILVNERPQERCSSCNLPLSLEKGKIVCCLPFDNATVDVSGRNTPVYETGIGYDDNGSTTNDLWEAIFDGDEDFVEIPHISDLNTSVFSFNFQFNKDEEFENGDLETLISKGDFGKNNMRYDVCIQKFNESEFDLVGTFYTEAGQMEVNIPRLQNHTWYDIAYVVGPDSISLYIDGFIYNQLPLESNLKGNVESLYLGTALDNELRTTFYNGRMDNFKYWKQKLSGQDVLFLHFPEKEFEVDQSYFLSCCEEAEFRDVIINKDNPLDSIIVPNASPTGYDSVYVLSYIQNDRPPQINPLIEQEDIHIQYQQQCDEFCQATAAWDIIASELFSDNCDEMTIEQSHTSPVMLDENISYVEVVYSATDDCGQSTTFSFALELECLPTEVESVPVENIFTTNVDGICIDDETQTICKYSDVLFTPGFLSEISSEFQMYNASSDFNVEMSINGITNNYSFDQVQSGINFPQLKEEGTYIICLESVSSLCETVSSTYCENIKIGGSIEVDHGVIEACVNSIEESLPDNISQELESLILSNPQEVKVEVSEADSCGCESTESIQLILNNDAEENLEVQICEGESYQGLTTPGIYIEELTTSLGCDSIITIELMVLPRSYEDVFVEICPDSTYMGYSEAGIYELINTNVMGCDSITTLNIEVLDPTDPLCFVSGTNDLIEEQFTIYPNPVSDILNITSQSSDLRIKSTTIYDTEGRLIIQNNERSSIDVSNLVRGIYILKVENTNSKVLMKMFVKN